MEDSYEQQKKQEQERIDRQKREIENLSKNIPISGDSNLEEQLRNMKEELEKSRKESEENERKFNESQMEHSKNMKQIKQEIDKTNNELDRTLGSDYSDTTKSMGLKTVIDSDGSLDYADSDDDNKEWSMDTDPITGEEDGPDSGDGKNDKLGKLIKLLSGLLTGGGKVQHGGALPSTTQQYSDIIDNFKNKLIILMKEYDNMNKTNKGEGDALIVFKRNMDKYTDGKLNIYNLGGLAEEVVNGPASEAMAPILEGQIKAVSSSKNKDKIDNNSLYKKLPTTFMENDDTINDFFNPEWKTVTEQFQNDADVLTDALFESLNSGNTGPLDSAPVPSSTNINITNNTYNTNITENTSVSSVQQQQQQNNVNEETTIIAPDSGAIRNKQKNRRL